MQGQTLDSYLEAQTQALKDAGLWRTLQPLAGAPGPTVRIGEEELVLLCSNNYLGIAADPRLAEAAAEATRALGTKTRSSRRDSAPSPAPSSVTRQPSSPL